MTTLFGTAPSREVIRQLENAGYEAVFVGGSVRDYLLGKPATDIDIATSAEPEEVKLLFPHTVDIGIAHGTVLVLMQGEPIEVTTFRTEGMYTDHRRPDDVQFVKSLREDLLRRDFTMNALAVKRDGELIDLFGGKEDLSHQLIRAVGNAADRFNEDALRMVRAIRFASVLGFDIEGETLSAIKEHAGLIRHISVERIKAEMDKLFIGSTPEKAFHYMELSGLTTYLPSFPQVTGRMVSTAPYHCALEGWACLMVVGDRLPSDIAKSYKLSNAEKSFLSSVHEAYEKRKTQTYAIEDYYRYELKVLLTTEKLYRTLQYDVETLSMDELIQRKQTLPIQSKKDLSVDGKDLIGWTGLNGGRWTGEWIDKIEIAVLHGECSNDPNDIKGWFLHEFNREK